MSPEVLGDVKIGLTIAKMKLLPTILSNVVYGNGIIRYMNYVIESFQWSSNW
jgi:hypothetical protein